MFKSQKSGYLAFNGLNNSFLKINQNLFDLINEAKNNIAVLSNIEAEIIDSLLKTLIITTKNEIESRITQKKFLHNYHTFQHDTLVLTLAPTSACNFRCFYCYEKGIAHKTINDSTIEKLTDYISERSKKTQNSVDITWYGGEPLLAVHQIDKIITQLKEKEVKIVHQGMITNGYYLNDENLEFLKRNKISFIQITLDGLNSTTHDARRKNTDGSGSWDVILENIDNVLRTKHEIQISIRCNVDKGNQEEYKILKDYLEQRWNKHPNISIYPGILRNHDDHSPNCQYFTDLESSNFLISQGLINKNLPYFQYNTGGCSATKYNACLIGPEGELYKCWNELGRADRIIGNIFDKKVMNKGLMLNYLTGLSMFDDETCMKCCLFFVCDGGCQYVRVTNHVDSRNENICKTHRINLEKYLETYYEIKQTKK